MKNRVALSLCLFVTLSACALPAVDRSAVTFNENDFEEDLDTCRGGNVVIASARIIGVALLGTAYGAVEGAVYGARKADTVEAAAIGAAVGGTLGLTAGGFVALKNHEAEITACLADKGYLVATTNRAVINRLRHRRR